MRHEQTTYDKIRSRIQLGDIIAFDGRSIYSWLVRTGTGARISHVGIACKTKVASYGHSIMEICESVKQGEDHETGQPITGVTRNRLSSRIANYNGEVYWFPLSPAARAALDYRAAISFLLSVMGRPYDMPQAIQSALDFCEDRLRILYACEDYSAFFCSELAAAALKAGSVIQTTINASETTPIDLLRQPIYDTTYYQLTGKPKPIKL